MESLTILLFSPVLFMGSNAAPTAVNQVGPFDVTFTDLKHCPEPSRGVGYDVKLVKLGRKKLVATANVTLVVPVDDELDVSINLAKQTSQGWKENFFILEAPKACTLMKAYIPGFEQEIGEQLKCGHCPYPVGNFSVIASLQLDVKVFPVFRYGKYLAKVNLLKNRKRVFCILGIFDVVPKKTG